MKFDLFTFVIWGFKMTGKVFDMDKIKRYVDRFIKKVAVNDRYDMSALELKILAQRVISGNVLDTISLTFNFGYIKGYKAAMAEIKKEDIRK